MATYEVGGAPMWLWVPLVMGPSMIVRRLTIAFYFLIFQGFLICVLLFLPKWADVYSMCT
jgi:hypothetical protein